MAYTIQSQIGDFTTSVNSVVVSGSVPTVIVPADPNRVLILLGNLSGRNVNVSVDPQVSTGGAPFMLRGNGATLQIWWQRHSVLTTMPWYGISLNGNATLYYVTVTYQPAPCPTSGV